MYKLLTVKEVASALRLSISQIYKLAENGVLPAKKLGSRLLFVETDLDAFISGCPAAACGEDSHEA